MDIQLIKKISFLFFLILGSFFIISSVQAATIGKPINYLTLGNGLVAHWTFDAKNISGTSVKDISGNAYDGTLTNTSSSIYTTGKISQALNFDGINDYISVGAAYNGVKSVSFWMKAATSTLNQKIMDLNGTANVNLALIAKNLSVSSQESIPTGFFFSTDGTKAYMIGVANTTIYQYTLSTPWDISSGSYASKSMSVAAQDSNPGALFLSPDGTKAYVVGSTNGRVFQYTLSTPWDISTGVYASKNMIFSAEAPTGTGLFLSPDGTKAYVAAYGLSNKKVYQYTLSTPWDISSGSYASKSMSVAVQDAGPHGVALSPDGTKAYIMGNNEDAVFQYTLATAWDISTESYASKSLSIISQDDEPSDLFLSPDGTKAYMLGETNDRMYQYTLATPWDISTGFYGGTDIIATNFDSATVYIDGTAAAVISDTKWHHIAITTATGINASALDIGRISGQHFGGSIDEVRMYNRALNASEVSQIYDFGKGKISTTPKQIISTDLVGHWTFDGKSMSNGVAQDLSGNNYFGSLRNIASTTFYSTGKIGQALNFDGINDYISVGAAYNGVKSVSFWMKAATTTFNQKIMDLNGTANVNSAQVIKNLSISSQETSPASLFFSPDGTIAYMAGKNSDSIHQYSLSIPWDISSGIYTSKTMSVAQDTFSEGIFFSPDGINVYVVGDNTNAVYQYTLATPWDLSTGSYASKSISVGAQTSNNPRGLSLSPDGTTMYVVANANQTAAVHQYTLATPWDLSTGSYASKSMAINVQITSPSGVFLSVGGTKVYVVRKAAGSSAIYQYTLATPWDLSTGSYDSKSLIVGDLETAPESVFVSPDGSRAYIVGNNGIIYQYTLLIPWNISSAFYGITDITATNFTSPTVYVDGSTASATITDTNWHHIAITTGTGINASALDIGRISDQYFGGSIDEIRMYNRALTASEVYQLNNSGKSKISATPSKSQSSNLAAVWTFDGKDMPSGTAKDISGNGKTGYLHNVSTSTFYVAGKRGQALNFDGTDDYISVGNAYNGVKSVAFWIKADNTTKKILDLNGSVSVEVSGGTITANNFADATIYVNGAVSSTITTDWHHVVITTGTGINASAVDIGRIGGGYFDGKLDDVRFFTTALSSTEALNLYRAGK